MKSKSLKRAFVPAKFQTQLRRTNTSRCWENKNWSARMQRRCRWPRQKHLKHRLIFTSVTSFLWNKNNSKQSCRQVLQTSLRSEPRKFLGKFWYHFTKLWWTMRNKCAIKELKNSLSYRCNCRSFHLEWRLTRKNDRRKLRKSKLPDKVPNSLSDLHCQRRYLTSREFIGNSLLSLRETRVHRGWLCPRLSISTSQSRIHHSASTLIKIIRSSIRRWGRGERGQPSWIKIYWKVQWIIHLQQRSIKPSLSAVDRLPVKRSLSRIKSSLKTMFAA